MDRYDNPCLAAAMALQVLYPRIVDRMVLASMMPQMVSTLVRVLKPNTQKRRSYRLLVVCNIIYLFGHFELIIGQESRF